MINVSVSVSFLFFFGGGVLKKAFRIAHLVYQVFLLFHYLGIFLSLKFPTTIPAFIRALGNPRMPIPILALRRCINACTPLKEKIVLRCLSGLPRCKDFSSQKVKAIYFICNLLIGQIYLLQNNEHF